MLALGPLRARAAHIRVAPLVVRDHGGISELLKLGLERRSLRPGLVELLKARVAETVPAAVLAEGALVASQATSAGRLNHGDPPLPTVLRWAQATGTLTQRLGTQGPKGPAGPGPENPGR
eukprot:9784161-Alexandrium_andersonii.AAC.1